MICRIILGYILQKKVFFIGLQFFKGEWAMIYYFLVEKNRILDSFFSEEKCWTMISLIII